MVRSAAALIARDGLQATGLREVADHAHAPRGSIRHHFPGGKAQLTSECVAWMGAVVADLLDQAAATAAGEEPTPEPLPPATSTGRELSTRPGGAVRVLDTFVQLWRRGLVDTELTTGCSLAAVVHDSEERELLTRVADVFATWRRPFHRALLVDGSSVEVADALATTVVAALEGAVILCRAQRDLAPLEQTAAALRYLLAQPPAALREPDAQVPGP